jgi:hypothetical protein
MRLVVILFVYCLAAVANASAAEITSISRLATGPDNVLFVADWKTARVHAITLPAAAQTPPGAAFNILDLELLLVPFGQIAGLDVTSAPLAGALRLDNLDEKSFIVVRRQLEKDTLQLVTVSKELSFRLSDFISEYAFQEYSFKGNEFQLKNIKPRQDMLLKDEGFADQIKPSN